MPKLSLTVTGEDLADLLQNAKALHYEIDKLVAAHTTTATTVSEVAAAETDTETEETPPPKKRGRKPKAAPAPEPEEETETEEEETQEEDDGFSEPVPAAKSKKEYSREDVAEAARAHAGRTNRAATLGILGSKFKVKSINDLKPAQYGEFIKALK